MSREDASGQAGATTRLIPPRSSTDRGHVHQLGCLVRSDAADKLDSCAKVTLRDWRWKGTSIRLYIADLDIRIVTFDGKLLRQLTLDTTRTYQPNGLVDGVREGSDVPR